MSRQILKTLITQELDKLTDDELLILWAFVRLEEVEENKKEN